MIYDHGTRGRDRSKVGGVVGEVASHRRIDEMTGSVQDDISMEFSTGCSSTCGIIEDIGGDRGYSV